MKRKNIGLLLSVSILLFMAAFSDKMVLVTPGYAVSRAEIETGRRIYAKFCRNCHDRPHSGAPRVGDPGAWQERIDQGVDVLVARAIRGYRGTSGVMPAKGGRAGLQNGEVAAAVAYMVRESCEKDN